jgi:excisionase family DNA binding protein
MGQKRIASMSKQNTAVVPVSETYSVMDAAKILGVGRDVAYEAARTGVIPTIRIGKQFRVPRVALQRLLERGTSQGAA